MRTTAHTPATVFPIVQLLGYMPGAGEEVQLLVKEAIEKDAVREEKEIQCAFQLRRNAQGELTGEVELFPFSSNEEELYLADLYSKYEGDPLEDLHWIEEPMGDVRHYTQVELPGGDVCVSHNVSRRRTPTH
jgi:hypothetical protein